MREASGKGVDQIDGVKETKHVKAAIGRNRGCDDGEKLRTWA